MGGGIGIAQLVEWWTGDWKVRSSTLGRSGRGIFPVQSLLSVPTLLFGVRSTPFVPQWHIKDPSHSSKSRSGQLKRAYTTDVGVGLVCCPGIIKEPTRETSSHAAGQRVLVRSCLSSL